MIRAMIALMCLAPVWGQDGHPTFTDSFGEDEKDLASTGSNRYFILEPGYVLEYEGKEKGKTVRLVITVTNETKKVAGVETRVIEERETVDGELEEVSRNYFAISKKTNNVYYFGEHVDIYEDGKITKHDGSWLAGKKGARYGLFMPATVLIGSRFQQEVAPGVAMDRCEVVSTTEKVETQAGTFENVVKIEESSSLETAKSHKWYAAGVGLVWDGNLKLVKCGKVERK